ncbi:hypothetical protein H8R17_00255 [Streptomyces sp. TRM68367]|nr:hypothetical protein [Streptomyces sp. TRM68367]MBC9723481.1 hypothetical protein [Streptomyces sp. TRM68367]
MGTKTVDETEAAEAKHDEEAVDVTKPDEGTEADGEAVQDASDETPDAEDGDEQDEEFQAKQEEGPSGVGQGAGAVVSVALGLVSLTGGWLGTVASAREQLIGQLHTAANAGVAAQVKEVYGDAWQTTALWAGVFALAALVVGVVVLARPAFGAPGKSQAPWIKSVSWAGVALGVIGLFLAVLKYTDVLLGLPSTSS